MRICKTYPIRSYYTIGYDFRCRQCSSDKKFFRQTYRRTDRGNNNMPELSSESAGIKITGPFLTKLSTKHLWVRRMQVCSTERQPHFSRRNNEIAKIDWSNLKIFFSRSTRPFSTKLGTKLPRSEGTQGFANIGLSIFQKGVNVFFSLKTNVMV